MLSKFKHSNPFRHLSLFNVNTPTMVEPFSSGGMQTPPPSHPTDPGTDTRRRRRCASAVAIVSLASSPLLQRRRRSRSAGIFAAVELASSPSLRWRRRRRCLALSPLLC